MVGKSSAFYFVVYHIKNPGLSLKISIAAAIVSLSFLFFKQIMVNEAGNYSKIISYNLGYWLWVLSAVIMLIGNLVSMNMVEAKKRA
jgi:Flp pilus assembly protein TadB